MSARGRRNDDDGAVVAEFAVALPAVAIVLALAIGGVSAGAQSVRLQSAADTAARLAARGEPADRVAAAVAGAGGVGGQAPALSIDRVGDTVCVTVTAAAPPFGVQRARGCTLAGALPAG
ncbi:TadE family type IV pilus minor pilin [Microbacterium hominis]|uniref:TadE family protein n=1 Tax=Microbacterium hominis TaxID=162426 RepID=A0A7D4QBS1_9MICO|nr:TadE family type IV pilus minor pilin [Microbacterium hominis]QKJ18777.1 hypothetical protein HQM25_04855 [Microbacterium hominis]